MTVPSLEEARHFYSSFGLDVKDEQGELTLQVHGSSHIWGRLRGGRHKKFESLTLHCFDDDLRSFRDHFAAQGVRVIPSADNDPGELWVRSPDGMLIRVRPGPKTTLDQADHRISALPVDGVRTAPYRSQVGAIHPRRLSHIALLTTSVPAQIDFFTRVLGLRLSDRSADGVAFMHAPHGSDHHLIALLASSGPGLHHLSWDVATVDEVGLGAAGMAAAGYESGWGVGRHVLGSNYFYYVQDPWGSFTEYSATMDYIPASAEWEAQDHLAKDSFYLWGPAVPPAMLINSEQGLWPSPS